jgi:hypothetical protein
VISHYYCIHVLYVMNADEYRFYFRVVWKALKIEWSCILIILTQASLRRLH